MCVQNVASRLRRLIQSCGKVSSKSVFVFRWKSGTAHAHTMVCKREVSHAKRLSVSHALLKQHVFEKENWTLGAWKQSLGQKLVNTYTSHFLLRNLQLHYLNIWCGSMECPSIQIDLSFCSILNSASNLFIQCCPSGLAATKEGDQRRRFGLQSVLLLLRRRGLLKRYTEATKSGTRKRSCSQSRKRATASKSKEETATQEEKETAH